MLTFISSEPLLRGEKNLEGFNSCLVQTESREPLPIVKEKIIFGRYIMSASKGN